MTNVGCRICSHPRRAEIDDRLIRGVGIRVIAHEFGLARSTVGGHAAKKHHANSLAGLNQTEEGAALVGVLRETMDAARDVAHKARQKGDLRAATTALAEIGRCADLLQRAAARKATAAGPLGDMTPGQRDHMIADLLGQMMARNPSLALVDVALPGLVTTRHGAGRLWTVFRRSIATWPDLRAEVAAEIAALDEASRAPRSEQSAETPTPANVIPFQKEGA